MEYLFINSAFIDSISPLISPTWCNLAFLQMYNKFIQYYIINVIYIYVRACVRACARARARACVCVGLID